MVVVRGMVEITDIFEMFGGPRNTAIQNTFVWHLVTLRDVTTEEGKKGKNNLTAFAP
jgi:hypothetical protein